ncbi:hypothetical protein IGI04_014320 [Brassica rapa subsp. trilocularis]|uniref:Uncharacterized protein n=1 Tax=Brassica rapa subsp. trilocularis TaxID=1813537 RepID=A0ABQ7MLW3_BRACM|nr:hypothetical protein IGI04_014320 [Brassica rapa subsp. trilocularis]
MKASMKFREEKNPLLRAKVPLSILGLPFQSGIVAGESKELSLNLSTFFESGPSLKLAYRPNDSHSPFSLVVKTGTGPFGSPVSASMLMSAEFNLLGKGNPTFMLHFKPRFGDFSIKKSHSSSGFDMIGPVNGEEDSSIEIGIEHVDGSGCKEVKPVSDPGLRNSDDVCLVLEELRSENRQLKRAVEDLRGVMVSNVRPFYPATVDYGSHSKYREAERSSNNNNNGRARGERWSSERTTSDYGGKKSKEEGDVAEELKKALKGAA